MSDYNLYNFTIEEKDIIRVLHDAASCGCTPLILINGMYYNVKLEPDAREKDGESVR